jgi:hypothetical protein
VAEPISESSTELPLDNFDWVPLDIPHRWLAERTGNGDLAALDLTKLLATPPPHGVRTMRRYFGRFRDLSRPDLEREQLDFSFWVKYQLSSWSDGLRIGLANRGVTYPIPAAGIYAWKPDLMRVWPDMFPAVPAKTPSPPPKLPALPREIAVRLRHGGQIDRVYPALQAEFPPFGKVPDALTGKQCAKRLAPHWVADNEALGLIDPSDDVIATAMKLLGWRSNS